MNKLLVTMILLCVSLNGYASCLDGIQEEMAYYIYMEENELNANYCLCTLGFKRNMETAESMKDIEAYDSSMEYIKKALKMNNEREKISKVLKKDYGKKPVPEEC